MRHRFNTGWINYGYYFEEPKKSIKFRYYKGRILFNITVNEIKQNNWKFDFNKARKYIENNFDNLFIKHYNLPTQY